MAWQKPDYVAPEEDKVDYLSKAGETLSRAIGHDRRSYDADPQGQRDSRGPETGQERHVIARRKERRQRETEAV